MDVFFYEAFAEEADEIRRHLPEDVEAGFTWKTIQEYGASRPPARIISVRTQSELPADWAEDLDAIISRSTGYDHLLAYRKKTGSDVALGYLPLYCHRSVAEHAALMWMSLARKLVMQVDAFTRFHRDNLTGLEIEGRTLTVVGVGNIGYEVVKIGRGLGMQVLGVDIYPTKKDVNYVDLDEALPKTDVLVCAMDLTESNAGYFNYELLKKAKPGLIFVNVSRGELSPSGDLLRLLQEDHLFGVSLDAFNEEQALAHTLREGKTSSQNPEVQAAIGLHWHPRAICTPHNAFNTEESVERKSLQSVQQIVQYLRKGKLIWACD